MLSDFVYSPEDNLALEDALKIASSKHDIMAIRVYDERDSVLPNVGIVELRDSESGRTEWVDSSSRKVRNFWAESYRERHERVTSLLRHNRVDVADVATDDDYVVNLIKMFKKR